MTTNEQFMDAKLVKAFNIEMIFDNYWASWSDEFFDLFYPECKDVELSPFDKRKYCYSKDTSKRPFRVENRMLDGDIFNNISNLYSLISSMSDNRMNIKKLIPLALGLIMTLDDTIDAIRKELSFVKKIGLKYRNGFLDLHELDYKVISTYSNFEVVPANSLYMSVLDEISEYEIKYCGHSDLKDFKDKAPNMTIGYIWGVTVDLIEKIKKVYNDNIFSLSHVHINIYDLDSYKNPFLYSIFSHHTNSLHHFEYKLKELPNKPFLEKIKEEFRELIPKFKTNSLGEHWAICMTEEDGFMPMVNYYKRRADDYILDVDIESWEKEEETFFQQLDKLCIMADILNGKADKYGLQIKYPKNWNCNTYGGLIKEEVPELVLNNEPPVWETYDFPDEEMMEEAARIQETARLYDQYLESQGQELCQSSPVPTGAGVKVLSETPNADIPQKCKDAVDRYINNSFTNEKTKEVLNSRGQLMKAAKGMNCEKKSNFGYLMQIAIEVKAIKADTSYMDFARMMVGLGVLNYENEKELAKYSGSIGKAKVDKTKELWKGLYKAITTK